MSAFFDLSLFATFGLPARLDEDAAQRRRRRMTVSVAERALTDGFALLERAMGYTLGGLVLVRPEDMAARTPCAAWDLRTLLLHMNHSLLTLHQAVAAGHLDLALPAARRPTTAIRPWTRWPACATAPAG